MGGKVLFFEQSATIQQIFLFRGKNASLLWWHRFLRGKAWIKNTNHSLLSIHMTAKIKNFLILLSTVRKFWYYVLLFRCLSWSKTLFLFWWSSVTNWWCSGVMYLTRRSFGWPSFERVMRIMTSYLVIWRQKACVEWAGKRLASMECAGLISN